MSSGRLNKNMGNDSFFRSKVSFLSLLCAVLVVFIHTYNITDINRKLFLPRIIETFISENIAQVAVPLFFAMSAFLFFRNFDMSKLFEKYKKRFSSVVIPYLIWNTIYLIFFFVASRFSFISLEPFPLNLKNIIRGVFLYEYNFVFWFLEHLIVFIILTPLIYLFMKNKWVGAFLIIVGVALYGCGFQIPFFRMDSLLFYLFGAYLALNFKVSIVNSNGFGWVSIPAFVLSQVLYYTGLQLTQLWSIVFRFFLIITLFFAYNFSKGIKLPQILNCSFPIYCLHTLILEALNKLSFYVIPENSNLILIDYFISPVITILIIAGVSFTLKTKLPKLYILLFGGR